MKKLLTLLTFALVAFSAKAQSCPDDNHPHAIDLGLPSAYFKDAEPEPYAVFNGNTLTFYYDKQRANRTGTTYDLNTAYDKPGWFVDHNCFQTQTVVFDASFVDARPTSCESWFCGMTGLTSIVHLDYLNTSEVTRMSYMFGRCQNLTTLDVSSFVTDNVTSMSYMFYQCYNLTTLEGLSSFNTGNVAQLSQ